MHSRIVAVIDSRLIMGRLCCIKCGWCHHGGQSETQSDRLVERTEKMSKRSIGRVAGSGVLRKSGVAGSRYVLLTQ